MHFESHILTYLVSGGKYLKGSYLKNCNVDCNMNCH